MRLRARRIQRGVSSPRGSAPFILFPTWDAMPPSPISRISPFLSLFVDCFAFLIPEMVDPPATVMKELRQSRHPFSEYFDIDVSELLEMSRPVSGFGVSEALTVRVDLHGLGQLALDFVKLFGLDVKLCQVVPNELSVI